MKQTKNPKPSHKGENKQIKHKGDVYWCFCPCHFKKDPVKSCKWDCWVEKDEILSV